VLQREPSERGGDGDSDGEQQHPNGLHRVQRVDVDRRDDHEPDGVVGDREEE